MAGSPSSRVGDIAVGICCCHPCPPCCVPWTGIVVTGASTIFSESSAEARIGDIVVGCHTQLIVGGGPKSKFEGPGAGRVGDPTSGCTSGVLVTGAGSVIVS